jgi:16S rRNA (cytosine1402-N4)-methyltransferase
MRFTHIPVLLEEVTSNLVSEKTEIFVDATVGGAGHSSFILERYRNLRLIGLDADEKALEIANEKLTAFKDRATLIRGNFKDLKAILTSIGASSIDGILFDLGLSTYQITGNRGFSFNDDTFLDMRMDNRESFTAYDVVNGYSYEDLKGIMEDYGEEYKAYRIAKAIVDERKKNPISTTKELNAIILKAKRRTGKIHPATKAFQAIRIEVNSELKNLTTGITDAVDVLAPQGRIGVISFHSLEDRIVKNVFKTSSLLMTTTKKPIKAGRSEMKQNPSSRGAKLRVAERE